MEVGLIKKNGETWTRFKVRTKAVPAWSKILENRYHVDTDKPYKQSKLYSYFETKGDLLNER